MKGKLHRKPKPWQLDKETAEQILSNVFSVCQHQPNTVPLSVLISYSNYRRERFALQRTLIVMMLVLFMILPSCFVVPRIVTSLTSDGTDSNPVYQVSVSTGSFIDIPVRKIIAQIEQRNMPVYKSDNNSYSVYPNANGEMTISVTLANRQISSIDITISSVDNSAPHLTSAEMTADYVYLYVEDEESGVDFDGVTIKTENGTLTQAHKVDEKKGCITVHYPEETIELSIPDTRGNLLTILLKPTN